LTDLAITAGSGKGATARITLKKGAKTLKVLSKGTGPVDAIYKGIQKLTKTNYILASYSIQAITGGTDAQGDVTVVLEHKDRRASARAAHTTCFSPRRKRTFRPSTAWRLEEHQLPKREFDHVRKEA